MMAGPTHDALPRPVRPAAGMLLGALSVVLFGGVGATVWLRWLWSRTPPAVRSAVPRRQRNAVIALTVGTAVAGVLGFVATVIGLIRAFGAVADVDPSEKAKVLAAGIEAAMRFTAAGLVVQLAGCPVALLVGWNLLRRSAALAPRVD